ncbi:MAG: hypothetical protein OJF55_000254 [Rhodanobacteraceae bacterium]|nr:MAG: hypothetical protein OJF55_000254 [Rhodanobacteraceae bacterium]
MIDCRPRMLIPVKQPGTCPRVPIDIRQQDRSAARASLRSMTGTM